MIGLGVLGLFASAYLGACALHFTAFAVMAQRSPEPFPPLVGGFRPRVVAMVPAWKEGQVVVQCARSLLALDYPAEQLEVVVIAQHLDEDVLQALRRLPITVTVDDRVPNTKAAAIRLALDDVGRDVDYVAILDADNLAHPDFLTRSVEALELGYAATQGLRLEKNHGTWLAQLESAMERINHAIYRRGRAVAGLPPCLAGSGMVFRLPSFRALMAKIDAVGGFDKQLEVELILMNLDCAWVEAAIVYDEKVDQLDAFIHQKRRWISAQFVFLSRYGTAALTHGTRRNSFAAFDKVMQWVAPPRSVLLMGLYALAVVSELLNVPGSTLYFGGWQ